MESTSTFHELLADLAHALGFTVFLLNSRDIRHYAKAVGKRAKTDHVDAQLIARYEVGWQSSAAEENELKPWLEQQWCIPEVGAEYVASMEDVLDLYAEPYDPKRPKVYFDETNKPLIQETRRPWPAEPGQPERYDYEYERRGPRNLFLFLEPQTGWRHLEVTHQRTMLEFAQQMKWLVEEGYPGAEKIRVVLDNLNTHKPASFYEAFPQPRRGGF